MQTNYSNKIITTDTTEKSQVFTDVCKFCGKSDEKTLAGFEICKHCTDMILKPKT